MLEAADLACERGGRALFGSLSLTVSAGDILRIAGHNGSGKTSLLRILCGARARCAGRASPFALWERSSRKI